MEEEACRPASELPNIQAFNTDCYHGYLPWFFIGCAIWGVVYLVIIRNSFKYRFIEMPAIALAANIAWEFTWGLVFQTNMGWAAQWTYRIWFLTDLPLFYLLWMYGDRQGWAPEIRKVFRPMLVGTTLAWLALFVLYPLSRGNELLHPTLHRSDHYIGAVTAYADNVVISATYLFQLSRLRDVRGLSRWVAWLKMIGTGLNTVFMFLVFPKDFFLQAMGVIIVILDVIYIRWLYRRRAAQALGIEGVPALDDPGPVVAP